MFRARAFFRACEKAPADGGLSFRNLAVPST